MFSEFARLLSFARSDRCDASARAHLAGAVILTVACAGAVPASAAPWTILKGNHSATAAAQLASAPAIAPNRTLRLAINLPLRNQAELHQLLREQQDPNSPQYHQWLTPDEFRARFGPTQAEVDTVANWLRSSGFQIDSAAAGHRAIEFHGSAAIAENAFAVKIAAAPNSSRFAALSDPSVPSAIAPLVVAISGLSTVPAWLPEFRAGQARLVQSPADKIGKHKLFGPIDLHTFYDENSLLQSGVDGTGTDCMAIVADSDYDPNSVAQFDSQYGLHSSVQYVYVDGSPPGETTDQFEALVDIEYSQAAAPGADVRVYIGNNSTASAYGALYDAAEGAVNDNSCSSINISFAVCGETPAYYTGVIDTLAERAASQGQVVTVASGDWGAAALVPDSTMTSCVPSRTRGVNELAADPNVLGVGGTQFRPKYDKSGFDVGSKRERAWNDHKKGYRGATGGGVSAVFSQPSYQHNAEPSQTMRTVPDVSLAASERRPGFVLFAPYAGQVGVYIAGGTSFAAPYWSGISHLVEQEIGGRPGPLNSAIYALGPGGTASGIRDARGGKNAYNHVKGYHARRGYDLATGWGTPDIGVLVPTLANH